MLRCRLKRILLTKQSTRVLALILAVCISITEVITINDLLEVQAASDVTMTVIMDADIPLTFNETLGAFTGSQLISESCDNARAHRIVKVTLPDEYEMNTPKGIRPAPEGTSVIYSGQMSARRGYHNRKSDNPYTAQIEVKIPFTEDFKEYGLGEYSLIIPVELAMEEAYGSYTEDFTFTPWATLIEKGVVTAAGGILSDLKGSSDVIEIDPSITELSNGFARGSTYREADIPASVASAYEAFEGSSIRELYFEGNTIPEGICKNMTSLVKAELAEGVTTFGDFVFKGCTSLSDFTFPNTMTTLGVSAFEDCLGLKELTIRSNLTTTNYSAVGSPLSYSGIERVIVEEGVTKIPARLYCNATALKELVLPTSLAEIGAQAFIGCSSLEELTIRSDITTGSTLSPFGGNGIKTLTFAEGVTSIPSYFFDKSCSAVESLYLPSTLTSIGYNAFRGTSTMTVYYAGTQEQWERIDKRSFNPSNIVYGEDAPLNLMSALMLSSAMPDAEEMMETEGMDTDGAGQDALYFDDADDLKLDAPMDEESVREPEIIKKAIEEPEIIEESPLDEEEQAPEGEAEVSAEASVIQNENEESSEEEPDDPAEDALDSDTDNEDPSSPSGDGSFGMTEDEPEDSEEATVDTTDAPLETPFEPEDPEVPIDPEEEDWIEDDPSLPFKDPEEELIDEPITFGP